MIFPSLRHLQDSTVALEKLVSSFRATENNIVSRNCFVTCLQVGHTLPTYVS